MISRINYLRVLYIAVAVIAATGATCILTGCGGRETEAVVGRRNITEYVDVEGEAAAPPVAEALVRSPYEAPVQKVYVTVGQGVKEGDILMELSAPTSEAYYQQARQRVQQARNDLATARSRYQSNLDTLRRNLERARADERRVRQQLRASEETPGAGVTGTDLQAATDRRVSAEQAVVDAEQTMESGLVPYERQLAAAEQEFKDAQSGVKQAMIRTPITGTVLSVNAKAGDTVSPDQKQAVARVVDLEALRVYGEVDDEAVGRLEAGDPVTLHFEEIKGEEFKGTLRNVYSENAGILKGVEHTAVFTFANRKGLVKPGMDAHAMVQVGKVENVLAVPSEAVYETDDRQAVRVRSGKEWRQRIVETGLSDGKYTEIKSGLKEGDVVRLSGKVLD